MGLGMSKDPTDGGGDAEKRGSVPSPDRNERGGGGSKSVSYRRDPVDAALLMWQRALHAKTAALDRLRSEMEDLRVRTQQVTLSQAHATNLVLPETQGEMEEGESPLDTLAASPQQSSEMSTTHELTVRTASLQPLTLNPERRTLNPTP